MGRDPRAAARDPRRKSPAVAPKAPPPQEPSKAPEGASGPNTAQAPSNQEEQPLGTLQTLVANEKMTDLLVELIHGAHIKNKKGHPDAVRAALKRKAAAAQVAASSRPVKQATQLKKISRSELRNRDQADFIQVCTVKRDRRTVEDIEEEMRRERALETVDLDDHGLDYM